MVNLPRKTLCMPLDYLNPSGHFLGFLNILNKSWKGFHTTYIYLILTLLHRDTSILKWTIFFFQLNIFNFKSKPRNNHFAPEWSYFLCEKIINDIDCKKLSAFLLAKENSPSIIFMDEVDSVGSSRNNSENSGGDSEVQRTMLELLN